MSSIGPREFLQNYLEFGSEVRIATASSHLNNLKTLSNPRGRKMSMVRIVDELISLCEDYGYWLDAAKNRESLNPGAKDMWQHILLSKDPAPTLLSVSRAESNVEFLQTLDFPSIKQLAIKLGLTQSKMRDVVSLLRKAAQSSSDNLTISDKLLWQFHNKVKHGMMVLDDASGVSLVNVLAKKGVVIQSKNMHLDVDADKAEEIYQTMRIISQAEQWLIKMLLAL